MDDKVNDQNKAEAVEKRVNQAPGRNPNDLAERVIAKNPRGWLATKFAIAMMGFLFFAGIDLGINHQIVAAMKVDALGQSTVSSLIAWGSAFIGLITLVTTAHLWRGNRKRMSAGLYVAFIGFLALGVAPQWHTTIVDSWLQINNNGVLGGFGQVAGSATNLPLSLELIAIVVIATMYTLPGLLAARIEGYLIELVHRFQYVLEAQARITKFKEIESLRDQVQYIEKIITNHDSTVQTVGNLFAKSMIDKVIARYEQVKSDHEITSATALEDRPKMAAIQYQAEQAIAKAKQVISDAMKQLPSASAAQPNQTPGG